MLRPYGVPGYESGFTKSDFVLLPIVAEVGRRGGPLALQIFAQPGQGVVTG